jgi:hypothetical protein
MVSIRRLSQRVQRVLVRKGLGSYTSEFAEIFVVSDSTLAFLRENIASPARTTSSAILSASRLKASPATRTNYCLAKNDSKTFYN